jgi:hypothetical protein
MECIFSNRHNQLEAFCVLAKTKSELVASLNSEAAFDVMRDLAAEFPRTATKLRGVADALEQAQLRILVAASAAAEAA